MTNSSALKNEVVSAGKHGLIYVVGNAVSRVVGFFMIPVYTHFIAPAEYGVFGIIGIVSACVMMLISLNASDTMSRFYYAIDDSVERNKIVTTTIIGFGVMGLVVVLIFVNMAEFLSSIILQTVNYKQWIAISLITAWFSMLFEIGKSYLRMRYYSKIFVTVTLIQLILSLSLNIYFVVYKGIGVLGILYSTFFANCLVGVGLVSIIIIQLKPIFSIEILLKLVKYGLPLVPSRITLYLGLLSNRFFLQHFASFADVGIFSLGFKFGAIVSQFVTTPINLFWAPRRIELLVGRKLDADRIVAKMCTYGTFISVFIALGVSTPIKSVIKVIADQRYYDAHKVVPVIVLAIVIGGIENHVNAGILYKQKTKLMSYFGFISLFIVLVWNFLFIPHFGLLGAATGILAGNLARTSLVYYFSQKIYFIPYEISRIIKMFLVAFVLYFVGISVEMQSIFLTVLVQFSIIMLFPFGLFCVKFFRKEELYYIKGYLHVLYLKFP